MWIVRFEMVTPTDHPEHYRVGRDRQHASVEPRSVPEEHWRAVAVAHLVHPDAVQHFRGLKELVARGELVRAVHLSRVVDSQLVSAEEHDPEGEEQQGAAGCADGEEDQSGQHAPDPAR
jgi:hypothetical protein